MDTMSIWLGLFLCIEVGKLGILGICGVVYLSEHFDKRLDRLLSECYNNHKEREGEED